MLVPSTLRPATSSEGQDPRHLRASKSDLWFLPVRPALLIIGRLLFPSLPLRDDKHACDGLLHPVHRKHDKFHRDKVQHPSVPSIYSVIDYC